MLRLVAALAVVVACTTSPPPPSPPPSPPPPPADVATGVVGAWQAAAALPTPRANHCVAAIDDRVFVIGGNHMAGSGFVKTDEIHAARLAADGTLGPWQLAGHTHSPVSECNATSDGQRLYVIDGLYDQPEDNGKVWTAELDASGQLGALTVLGAMPPGVVAISQGAAIRRGALLLMHARLPDPNNAADRGDTETLRTAATTAAWSTGDWHLPFRARTQYAFADRFVLALGGYHDPASGAIAEAYVAAIADGGAIGAPQPTRPLPMPVAFGAAVAVDDWVFVVGGRAQVFGGTASAAVLAAPIGADGALGAWQQATPLSVGRTNHALAVVGDYLVVPGGATTGGGDAQVMVARVRYPAR